MSVDGCGIWIMEMDYIELLKYRDSLRKDLKNINEKIDTYVAKLIEKGAEIE